MEVRLVEEKSPTCKTLIIGDIWILFSYFTPVAFKVVGQEWTIRNNTWGSTTAKHIAQVTGYKIAEQRSMDLIVSSTKFRTDLDELLNTRVKT